MEEKKFIYLDHAATTAARPEVVEAMLPYFTEKFGNPSSVYTFSQQNKAVITQCRDVIANRAMKYILRQAVQSRITGR